MLNAAVEEGSRTTQREGCAAHRMGNCCNGEWGGYYGGWGGGPRRVVGTKGGITSHTCARPGWWGRSVYERCHTLQAGRNSSKV